MGDNVCEFIEWVVFVFLGKGENYFWMFIGIFFYGEFSLLIIIEKRVREILL